MGCFSLCPRHARALGIYPSFGRNPNTTMQAVIFSAELALIAVIALPILFRQRPHNQAVQGSVSPNRFVRVFGPLYLVVLAALWISVLPDYFSETHGSTTDGTPIGSLVYASVCFVIATVAIYSVTRAPILRGVPQGTSRWAGRS
jgi:hypothetical protein